MNIKKLWEKILQLPDAIQNILGIVIIISIATVTAIIIVETLMFFDRSHCLDSQYPRRYRRQEGNGICEEYRGGEWREPSKGGIYFYNEPGSRITE